MIHSESGYVNTSSCQFQRPEAWIEKDDSSWCWKEDGGFRHLIASMSNVLGTASHPSVESHPIVELLNIIFLRT
jgi:hypothetical protein